MSDPHEEEIAVADPIVTTKTLPRKRPAQATETRREPPYNVIILNDEDHTFEYVIELLSKLFRHPLERARQLTWEVHSRGRAIVFTTHRELAELKRDQVLAYGPDPRLSRSKGPIGCVIEPAQAD
jgi:ATP-dependent Clp protease adaptor protein ClpS